MHNTNNANRRQEGENSEALIPLTLGPTQSHPNRNGHHDSNPDVEESWFYIALADGVKVPRRGSHGIKDAQQGRAHVAGCKTWACVPHLSGVEVLDFDFEKHGREVLEAIVERCGSDVLDTPTVRTRDGVHLYFLPPPPEAVPPIPGAHALKYKLKTEAGLEIKGAATTLSERYYVVAAGSVVVDRNRNPPAHTYPWEAGKSPTEISLRVLPPEALLAVWEYAQSAVSEPVVASEPCQPPDKAELREPKELTPWDTDAGAARAVCALLGMPFLPGHTIRSPLRPDETHSCEVWLTNRGTYRFHDFSVDKQWSLTQVYASWRTGKSYPLDKMGRIEYAAWRSRLSLEIGFEKPLPVGLDRAATLPPKASEEVRRAWEGFLELCQCRSQYHGEIQPAPYTSPFCARWCGLDDAEAKRAIQWLWRHGYLRKVGHHTGRGHFKPASLYLPLLNSE